jgi:spermidine synthase
MNTKAFFLLSLCFLLGLLTMALEVAGFRILAPYFGYSVYVSGGLIGVVLIAMSMGYFLGGALSKKQAGAWLSRLVLLSAAYYLLFLLSYRWILGGLINLGEVWGSVISSLILFAPTMLLLSATNPLVISLLSKRKQEGVASSRAYAFSTLGSVAGVFLGTFVLLPLLGTRLMLLVCFSLLVIISIILNLRNKLLLALLIISLAIPFLIEDQHKEALFYKDSAYNLVKVYLSGSELSLILNQDIYAHSMYDPNAVLLNEYYDFFNLAPFLLGREVRPDTPLQFLVLGMGAGTSLHQLKHFFPGSAIDAVELDPVVIDVAYDYFEIGGLSDVTVYAKDARPFIKASGKAYDVIEIDAYSGGVYVPFYLLTREFFQETALALAPDGAIVLNLYLISSQTKAAGQYLDAVIATLGTSFPSVYVVPLGDNTVIFASKRQLTQAETQSLIRSIGEKAGFGELTYVAQYANDRGYSASRHGLVLTDDSAPVEQYTHRILAGT